MNNEQHTPATAPGPAPGSRGDVETAYFEWANKTFSDETPISLVELDRIRDGFKAGAEWAAPSKEVQAVLDAARAVSKCPTTNSQYIELLSDQDDAVRRLERVEAGRECECEKGGNNGS